MRSDDEQTGRGDGHQACGGGGAKEMTLKCRTLGSSGTSVDSGGRSTLAVSDAPRGWWVVYLGGSLDA
jgi:hypothetical protein